MLFARGIRQCIDLTYAAAARQTIWEYAPASRAAEDYSALIDMLEGVGPSESRNHGQATEVRPSIH